MNKKVKKEYTEKEKTKIAAIKLLTKILIIIGIIFIVLNFISGIFMSHDNNMFPKVGDGDLAITYRLDGYYAGDVVVYKHKDKTHFGRVVAIAGDEINIKEDGTYTVNGTIPYEVIYYKTLPTESVKYPYKLKDGEVFILNDMREDMNDSRTFGPISVKDLKGKIVLLLRRRGF